MIKAVLDTNIFVGAFLVKNGYTAKILRDGSFQIIISEYIFEELRDVLYRLKLKKKYNFMDDEIERFIKSIREISTLINVNVKISDLDHRDPDDNMILACAVEAQAEYIVTRDNDLLSINPYGNIKVITPEEFFYLLK